MNSDDWMEMDGNQDGWEAGSFSPDGGTGDYVAEFAAFCLGVCTADTEGGVEVGRLSLVDGTGEGGTSDWVGKESGIAVDMDGDVVWFSDNKDSAVRLPEDAVVELAGSIWITTVALIDKF